jgi:antitoxin VapB
MSLNIKDPEAHRLARMLAQETGESMTRAVTSALKEKLGRVRKKRARRKISVDEMMAIGKRVRSHVKGPVPDHAELLYDERGLPK